MSAAKGFLLNVYEHDMTPLGERLLQLPIRIGRSSLNDVCVSHRLVSEFHARVEEVDGRLCVRDLSSKNGVLVEAVGSDGSARVAAQVPVDLEPYGYEFLLSPLLRVRLRPAPGHEGAGARHSQAVGSVLGNAGFLVSAGSALAEDRLTEGFTPRTNGSAPPAQGSAPPARGSAPPASLPEPPHLHPLEGAGHRAGSWAQPPSAPAPRALRGALAHTAPQGSPPSASPAVQPYASVFIEPPAGTLELPPITGPDARVELPPVAEARVPTRVSQPSPPRVRQASPRASTWLEPSASEQPIVPALQHTAWENANGTLPAAVASMPRPSEPPERSLESLALRGLRELAASLVPGRPVESGADIVRLVTKLHDALEMFCRCFIPVREACSRFIATDELEQSAAERCHGRSDSYVAIERALEPRSVAAALLDWRNDDADAPRAVEHILADLMLHHLALSLAAIEGTRGLLDELSPARIEGQQTQTPTMLSRLGLGGREKALWEAFAQRHAELESVGRTFRELFGEQFSRAYAGHYPEPGSGSSI